MLAEPRLCASLRRPPQLTRPDMHKPHQSAYWGRFTGSPLPQFTRRGQGQKMIPNHQKKKKVAAQARRRRLFHLELTLTRFTRSALNLAWRLLTPAAERNNLRRQRCPT